MDRTLGGLGGLILGSLTLGGLPLGGLTLGGLTLRWFYPRWNALDKLITFYRAVHIHWPH